MKNKIIFINTLIILFLVLSSCETEIPQQKINTPLGLTYCTAAGDDCLDASTPGTKIVIYFWAFNSEATFSGYNIYIGSSKSEIENARDNHISGTGEDATIDESIETNYIVKNDDGGYPTVTKSYLSSNNVFYYSEMSVVQYEILDANSPAGTTSGLWIGVSAFSETDKNESNLSNLIEIP